MARILVVDDDADIRELVTMKLTNAGYDVIRSADGETGLSAVLLLTARAQESDIANGKRSAGEGLVAEHVPRRPLGPVRCHGVGEHPARQTLFGIMQRTMFDECVDDGARGGAGHRPDDEGTSGAEPRDQPDLEDRDTGDDAKRSTRSEIETHPAGRFSRRTAFVASAES
jgi:hypothetical protein